MVEIAQIQQLCADGKIKWSIHSAEMMHKRGISRGDVINCLRAGEIIEDYPDDFPYPSCLVFGYAVAGTALHTVVGVSQETLVVITAYIPDTIKFEPDLKTRRKQYD